MTRNNLIEDLVNAQLNAGSGAGWQSPQATGLVPMVVEQSGRGERAFGLAIYDTMKFIKPDVSTLCMGLAASMGSFLLAAGAKEKRFSLPNARIMIHQPSGGAQGQASDIEIHAKEILYIRERLNKILVESTGQSLETIEKDTDRDNFMSAESAKDYGIIDKVLETRAQVS